MTRKKVVILKLVIGSESLLFLLDIFGFNDDDEWYSRRAYFQKCARVYDAVME